MLLLFPFKELQIKKKKEDTKSQTKSCSFLFVKGLAFRHSQLAPISGGATVSVWIEGRLYVQFISLQHFQFLVHLTRYGISKNINPTAPMILQRKLGSLNHFPNQTPAHEDKSIRHGKWGRDKTLVLSTNWMGLEPIPAASIRLISTADTFSGI